MNKSPLLLIGPGGHSRSCIDVIEQEGHFYIYGLLGLTDEIGTEVLGYSVIGTDSDLENKLQETKAAVIITIGQIKTPNHRMKLFQYAESFGAKLPNIVSPYAYVSPYSTIGKGTIVMHGAIVNAGVVIGDNCIINSQSLIEHDSVIADHCHISTAVVINGNVSIGEGTFIGSNSSVREGVSIGERCLIGMGQRILKDYDAGSELPPSRNTV